MRLLVVSHYFPEHRGGVEIIAGELASRLAARGFELTWAASAVDEPAGEGVRFLPLATCNLSERWLGVPYPIWGPAGLARLWREVRRSDAVHLHDCLYMGNVLAAFAARRLGKPLIVTQHIGIVPYSSAVLRGAMGLANRIFGRYVLRGADRCVFYSEKAQSYYSFLGLGAAASFVPNGVAPAFRPAVEADRQRLRRERGFAPDEPLVLFVGRFVEKKGLVHVRRLAAGDPQWRWALIGWGPIDPRSWQLPNVNCVGSLRQQEIIEWYQAADLLVLPSVGEGFPLVIQEAMACGTPVLMSDDTALGFAAVRDVSFVAGFEPEGLERAFRAALSAPAELAAMRERVARFAAEHWDWERCADRYRDLLVEVAADPGAGRAC